MLLLPDPCLLGSVWHIDGIGAIYGLIQQGLHHEVVQTRTLMSLASNATCSSLINASFVLLAVFIFSVLTDTIVIMIKYNIKYNILLWVLKSTHRVLNPKCKTTENTGPT